VPCAHGEPHSAILMHWCLCTHGLREALLPGRQLLYFFKRALPAGLITDWLGWPCSPWATVATWQASQLLLPMWHLHRLLQQQQHAVLEEAGCCAHVVPAESFAPCHGHCSCLAVHSAVRATRWRSFHPYIHSNACGPHQLALVVLHSSRPDV
jgi:hypothetical protein